MTKRIGLFGGTFNPIHLGHAILAQRVYDDFKLDELIFIPSKLPPHKNVVGVTAAQRYDMAKLTAEVLGDGFRVSDYELLTDGISYSHRTVTHWRHTHPDDAIYFITGTDIFITITTWQNWEDLFNQCNFIVVNREGTDFEEVVGKLPQALRSRVVYFEDYQGEIKGKIILYTMPPVSVSSTQIRGCMAEAFCPELLLENVYKYITDNRLYSNKEIR